MLKIKSDGISTGDFVTTENGVIIDVLPRKNKLKRPNVANVDIVAIVVGRPPEPDFYLIDKLIGICTINSIDVVIIVNKLDLEAENAKRIDENYSGAVSGIYKVSAKTGEGIERLLARLRATFDTGSIYDGDPVISNSRHLDALRQALDALHRALTALDDDRPADLLSEDIRQVIHHLGTITGEITNDDILGQIFSKFCIGK